jgi:hypothetical protein
MFSMVNSVRGVFPKTVAIYLAAVIMPYFPTGPGEPDLALDSIVTKINNIVEKIIKALEGKKMLQSKERTHLIDILVSPDVMCRDGFLAPLSNILLPYDLQRINALRELCLTMMRECLGLDISEPIALNILIKCVANSVIKKRFDTLVLNTGKDRAYVLNLYYWLTRYIPPEHIIAAYLSSLPSYSSSTNMIGARLCDSEILRIKLSDSHVHLTAMHPTLLVRLQLANPFFARDYANAVSALDSLGVREKAKANNVAKLAIFHGIVRALIYAYLDRANMSKIVRILRSLANIGDNVSLSLLGNIYGQLLRSINAPRLSKVVDPLSALENKTSIEFEREIILQSLNNFDNEYIAHLASLYIRLASIIHRYIVFQPGYRGLELLASLYWRSEARSPGVYAGLREQLITDTLKQYRGIRVCAKASPSDRKLIHSITKIAPKDLYIFLSFIKKPGSCTSNIVPLCYKALQRAMKTYNRITRLLAKEPTRRIIVGIDVAGAEREVPNWVYKPFIEKLRKTLTKTLLLSVHAGEDYYNLANGLRHIYEAVELIGLGPGDSIGHGLALVSSPETNVELVEPASQLLFDLVFLVSMIEEEGIGSSSTHGLLVSSAEQLGNKIFTWSKDTVSATLPSLKEFYQALFNPRQILYAALNNKARRLYKIATMLLELGYSEDPVTSNAAKLISAYMANPAIIRSANTYIEINKWLNISHVKETLKEVQELLAQKLSQKEVIVESCPTSNIAIRLHIDPSEHPLTAFLDKGLAVCIGSDDPAPLSTDIWFEALITKTLLLKKHGAMKTYKVLEEIASCAPRKRYI